MRSLRSPVPTCDLRSAARVACRRGALLLVQPGAQDLHRLGAVLVLALLLLHRNDDAGRHMRDPHGAFGLVDVLAAGAGGTVTVDAQIALVDLDIDFLGFRQHGDGHGRGVDAALAFGGRHALHAVHAGFVFQPREHAAAGDLGDALLQPAKLGFAIFQHLEAPAAQRRVFLIHREQFGGEQRGFVAAGGGPHFQDGRTLVGFVLWQHRHADLVLQRRDAVSQAFEFGLGQFAQFGIGKHRFGLGARLLGGAQFADAVDSTGSSSASSFEALDVGVARQSLGQ